MRLIQAIGLAILTGATAAAPASAAPRRPQAAPLAVAPPPSVTAILSRSGTDGAIPLRDLLGAAAAAPRADDGLVRYAEARAAIRACQAKRYAASAARMLDGMPRPLRDC